MCLWVVAALKAEMKTVRKSLEAEFQGREAGFPHYLAKSEKAKIRLGITGVGVTSAALALGAFFTLDRPDMALMVGSAGALPESGLAVGDLITAETEILSELGVARSAGIGDAAPLKLPDMPQEIAFDPPLTRRLAEASASVAPARCGKVLTVVGVSARPEQALDRARHFHAVAENMEGYALALAGKRFGIPAAEVRGISNAAGDRDRNLWDFRTAVDRAQLAVLEFLGQRS